MRGVFLALLVLGPVASAAPKALPPCEHPTPVDTTDAPAFPEALQTTFGNLVRAELAQGLTAGMSVGVSLGQQRWVCGYGLRDLGRKLPATPRTTYRMASITKSFTAVAALQLVEQGKLGLDDDVRSRVPSYPEKQWKVTVRDLLGHLSGVPTYDSPRAGDNTKPVTTLEALTVFAQKPLVFEPGTRYLYTTWGFNLLGAAVESAAGQPYGEYLQQHVFTPAGMHHAALDDFRTRDEHQAAGYRIGRAGRLVASEYLDVSSRFGGGGTRASVEDMLAFGRAVMEHKLVSRTTMGTMQTSMSTRDGKLTDYGMGFATYPVRGHYIVAHAGGQPETSALLVILPAEDAVIALVTNVENEAKRLRRLTYRLMDALVDGSNTRRDLHFADPVDAVVYEGISRITSYGLAYHGWATRGPGTLPAEADLPGAFARVSALLDRATIAREPRAALERVRSGHDPRSDSVFIRVGTHMARTVEQALGAERLRTYPAQGPLAFFADYLAACEASSTCPEALRFAAPVRADVRRFEAGWKRAQLPELQRLRLDEVKDPERHWPTLEKATAAAPDLHPDYTDELVRIAERFEQQSRAEPRLRWLTRAVALHPQSVDARLALAEAQLGLKQEAAALQGLREASGLLEAGTALSPAMLLKRVAQTSAPLVARGLLRAGVDLHPESPELWEALAKRERAMGNPSGATQALKQARRARAMPPAAVQALSPRPTGDQGPIPDDAGLVRRRLQERAAPTAAVEAPVP
ncbi:serine hydrolase [Myxococcaceae bacterium GXIMD 01537]